MAKWKVYGNTWFYAEVEADDQETAEFEGLAKLMDCESVKFNVRFFESELEYA